MTQHTAVRAKAELSHVEMEFVASTALIHCSPSVGWQLACVKTNDRNPSFFAFKEKKEKSPRSPHGEQTFMLTFDWQGLFRNYGDMFLPLLWPHLEQLASDPHESSQRCVCEITAGLIRGSKLWSFSQVPETHTHTHTHIQKQIYTLCSFLIRKVNINKKLSLLCVCVCSGGQAVEGFVPFDQDSANQHHSGDLHRLGHLHRHRLRELLACIQTHPAQQKLCDQ